jgi:hypothetical protein
MHPSWRQPEILQESSPPVDWQRPLQIFASLLSYMILPQFAERLDQKTAEPAGRRHVSRRCPPELDRRRADLNSAAWSICQKHDFGRNLIGKTQGVRRIRASRLKTRMIAARQGLCHFVGGRLEQPKSRVLFRKIVDAAGEAANGALSDESMERNIDCLAAADVQKVGWNKNGSSPAALYGRTYL